MPPPKDNTNVAICALIFSIITLICCGPYLICLTCSIPALILAIMAMTSNGTKQTNNAGISITLNVVVIVCSVVTVIFTSFLPIFLVVPVAAVSSSSSSYRASSNYCYYSSSYSRYRCS